MSVAKKIEKRQWELLESNDVHVELIKSGDLKKSLYYQKNFSEYKNLPKSERLHTDLVLEVSFKLWQFYFIKAHEEIVGDSQYPEWMKKYTTQELEDNINNLKRDKVVDSVFEDEKILDMFIKSSSLVSARQNQIFFETGKEVFTNEEIDAILFPSKKIQAIKGSLPWNIDNWNELCIIIHENNYGEVGFAKMYQGKLSNESLTKISTEDLKLGIKTIEILGFLTYAKEINIQNRDSIYRINKVLKLLTGLNDNAISKNEKGYTISCHVDKYDLYGQPVIDKHIHSHGGVVQDEQQIRADEITDIINDEDEENIYRERDNDGEELNFNY